MTQLARGESAHLAVAQPLVGPSVAPAGGRPLPHATPQHDPGLSNMTLSRGERREAGGGRWADAHCPAAAAKRSNTDIPSARPAIPSTPAAAATGAARAPCGGCATCTAGPVAEGGGASPRTAHRKRQHHACSGACSGRAGARLKEALTRLAHPLEQAAMCGQRARRGGPRLVRPAPGG